MKALLTAFDIDLDVLFRILDAIFSIRCYIKLDLSTRNKKKIWSTEFIGIYYASNGGTKTPEENLKQMFTIKKSNL